MTAFDRVTTTTNNHSKQETRGVFWRWVGANALGLGVGMAIFAAVAEGVEQSGMLGSPAVGEMAGHIIGLALAGTLFGIAQRSVLQRFGAVSRWAILGTMIGLLLGYVAGYELGGPPIDFVLAPTLAALFGGLRQAYATPGLRGWPWVNATGMLFGAVMGTAVAMAGLGDALGGGYLGWVALNGIVFAIAGAAGGAISGAYLRRKAS